MNEEKAYKRPVCTVITLPDPDQMPVTHEVQATGTIEWRSEAHQYPNFEIRFIGPNPEDDDVDKTYQGSDTAPVVLRVKDSGNVYEYQVSQFSANGKRKTSPIVAFRVQTCDGCHS